MRKVIRGATSGALLGVGALHLAWALGSHFPARSERDLARSVTGDDTMPPRAASAVVGLGLSVVAVAALPIADGIPGSAALRRLAGAALLGRAVVPSSPLLSALRLPTPAPEFVRLDRVGYRPLCLALGAALLTDLAGSQAHAR